MHERKILDLETPYDVKSVMHTNGRACWLGYGPDVLENRRSDETIIGAKFNAMSPIDELEVNRFYSCPDQEYYLK